MINLAVTVRCVLASVWGVAYESRGGIIILFTSIQFPFRLTRSHSLLPVVEDRKTERRGDGTFYST